MSGIDPAEVAACQDTGYVVRVRHGRFVQRIGQISSERQALSAGARQGARP